MRYIASFVIGVCILALACAAKDPPKYFMVIWDNPKSNSDSNIVWPVMTKTGEVKVLLVKSNIYGAKGYVMFLTNWSKWKFFTNVPGTNRSFKVPNSGKAMLFHVGQSNVITKMAFP